MKSLEERFVGALIGLACGDAVGTTVEFSPRGTFQPVVGMAGGGPFGLEPGQWTDDTSMALCLAESLVEKGAFDPADQMSRYLDWWQRGYLSSNGTCFDIGNTVRRALIEFQRTGNPYAGSRDPWSSGNGSLMRLAPVVMFGFRKPGAIPQLAADSSRTTHGSAEAIESCQLFALLMYRVFAGYPKPEILKGLAQEWHQEKVRTIASGEFTSKRYESLVGSGYCIQSLEAALWCFLNTESYSEAVLAAVNLGDDADTTGAITGQLAGAYYGVSSMPAEWISPLAMREEIEGLARRLCVRADPGDSLQAPRP